MKRKCLLLFGLFLTLLTSSLTAYAADAYTLDPHHTYLLWRIKHFGFSTQAGKWYANGSLMLDKEKPQNSKVKVTVNVGDVITGLPDLDKHLKEKLFFDVDQFPTATFISDKIEVTGKNTAKIQGILTLHGISKAITLNAKLNQMGINPISNKMTVGYSATTTIKRSDFGITTLLPGLADEVNIDIEVEAYKSS